MKYSITLSSFRQIEPVEVSIARLASQGFDAVEMYGEPEEVDLKLLKDVLSTTRLSVCGITGMWGRVSRHGGKRKLLSSDEALVEASQKYVKDCVRMCSQLGGNEMNICLFADEIEGFDKTHGAVAKAEKSKIITKVLPILAALCNDAANNGVRLVLEPLNRYSTPYCVTATDALEIVKQLDNLGILLDTFHMNIEEDSFEDAIFSCRKFLQHTHFADNNRKMPGFGHIDFEKIMASLQKINYNGYASFEPNLTDMSYKQTTKEGLEFIRNITTRLEQA